MRHTRITRWFEQGLVIKEIQYLAGHTTAQVTLEIYTHYQAETRMQETARKIQAM
jgi:integrase